MLKDCKGGILMMTRRLALVLAGAFAVSLLTVVMPAPADAVCRPYCLDMNKRGEHGENHDRGKHHHYGWAKHLLHKHHGKHRGHDDPPVTQPPVTPPPVEPPPSGPPPCIGC